MKRSVHVCLLVVLAAALFLLPERRGTVRASDCRRVSVNLTPITELGSDRYQGYLGGLYLDGSNTMPASHRALALAGTAAIRPLGPSGEASADGRIVLLSIGMTGAAFEFQSLAGLVAGDSQVNPKVLLVNGAAAGQYAAGMASPTAEYWGTVDARLSEAGATGSQVQAVWLKEAIRTPTGPFPESAETLRDNLVTIVGILHDRFPNLKLVYLSSRIYAGYASVNTSPEPYAYESAFAVRWVIEKQIVGDPAMKAAPVVLWGPYLWADGTTKRQDGLSWDCQDFESNGTHPSVVGRQKVANILLAFFKTDETAKPWFVVDQAATPLPSATLPPPPTTAATPTRGTRPTQMRPTMAPTITPGGPTPTPFPTVVRPTPVPSITPGGPTLTPDPTEAARMVSFRVREEPSGDMIWVVTYNRFLQQQLQRLSPERTAWMCGPVVPDPAAEWGFNFRADGLTLLADVEAALRTTIRAIADDPQAVAGAERCIRVSGATEYVPGVPPETGTPGTPVPTAGATSGPGPIVTRQATRTRRATTAPGPTATPSATPGGPKGILYLSRVAKYR